MKMIAIAVALLAAACKPASLPLTAADPSDPYAAVPPARYQAALGGYTSQRPVAPASWREQNEQVAPKRNR